MKRIVLVILVLFISFQNNFSQKDSTSKIQQERELINQVDASISLIQKSDSAKISDSIQKIVLRQQIEDLKSYEKSKRLKLEAELNEINRKDSLQRVNLKNELDSIKKVAVGFPVNPYKDTLFYFYTRIGRLTPKERTKIVLQRLEELYPIYFLSTDSLAVVDYGQTVDVVFKDKTLLSVTELDAMWFDKPKYEIADSYRMKIEEDIKVYKAERDIMVFVKEVGLTLLVIILQGFLIFGTNRLFKNKVKKIVWNKRSVWFNGIMINGQKIINQDQQALVIIYILNVLRYILIIFQLFITAPLLFSIYPPTQRLAETIFNYVLSPIRHFYQAFVNYFPNLFTVVIIVVITNYILKFIKYVFREIEDGKINLVGFYADWARPTYSLLRVFIYAFMIVTIFPYLPGSDSPIFKGMSVFLGLMFSLGSSSIIGNVVAGYVITYMRPFVIGDRIKIGDVVGDVVEKTVFVTRIKTPKREFITIPNSNVLSSHVINYSTSKHEDGGIILHTTVTIGYDVPWRKVHDLLIQSAVDTEAILTNPSPFVLQTSLDDFYVSYQLNAHTLESNKQPVIYSELHQKIQDNFNEAGVEILSPHYRAARDGNQVTIPEEYLPKDYKAPSFRISKDSDK